MNTLFQIIALSWRIPGFVISFLFYRGTRLLILSAAKRIFEKKLRAREKLSWTAYSESLEIPGALPYMMCTTSRWNPHAPLGSLGPFNVAEQIEIDLASPRKSARGWIITVFRGDFEVVKLIYPGNSKDEGWVKIDLPPDQYRILVRYYGYHGNTVFPAVRIDGMVACEARDVGDEMGKSLAFFEKNVVNRKGIFYFLTQYYIFQLLRWKIFLPENLVRHLYLPVGDPQITRYRYGIINASQQLELTFDNEIFDKADVYVTYCNRWGFPVFWDKVETNSFLSRAAPEDLVYLVRVVNFLNQEELELETYHFNDRVTQQEPVKVEDKWTSLQGVNAKNSRMLRGNLSQQESKMNIQKFVFWSGVYTISLGVSFFIPGYLAFFGFKTPDAMYWTLNTGCFVTFVGVILIYCSRNLKERAGIVYANAVLRILGFFMLAGFGLFGELGKIAILAGIIDLAIGVTYLLGLPANQKKSHGDLLLDREAA
jgi:hypothetical protein